MNLAVFDVDGTLTDTVQADNECLVRVFEEEFETRIQPVWSNFKHATDSGVSEELFINKYHRTPTREEILAIKKHFMDIIRSALNISPYMFKEIKGATDAIKRLKKSAEWDVAITSGGWTDSAILKQKNIDIDFRDLAFATADDSVDRSEILKISIYRSQQLYGVRQYEKIVYIADCPWDVEAARKIQISFLGRCKDEKDLDALVKAGAKKIIEDFNNFDLLLKLLEEAEIPVRKF
jgi:phosphoglycolate phosphatase-like HAD superfamily hydrolase